jgi:hypothetical protein
MRESDPASYGRGKLSKTPVNILRIASFAFALMLALIVQWSDARAYVASAKIDRLPDAPIAATLDRLRGISDTPAARAAETCAGIIKTARTVAKLELAIIACFEMKLTIDTVRAGLEKKTAALMKNKRAISAFISELPPDTEKEEERLPDETRAWVIWSIESPRIRPYIGAIDLSLKPSGEVNWIHLRISDQPI